MKGDSIYSSWLHARSEKEFFDVTALKNRGDTDMNLERKTYISFLYENEDENWSEVVKTRELSKVVVPNDAYGFYFFDILNGVADIEGTRIEFINSRVNMSSTYFCGGEFVNVRELKGRSVKMGARAIKSRNGNVHAFWRGDVLLSKEEYRTFQTSHFIRTIKLR